MSRPSPGKEWLLIGFVLTVVGSLFLTCGCGHFLPIALQIPFFAVFCAWFPRIDSKIESLGLRLAAALVRILATLWLLSLGYGAILH